MRRAFSFASNSGIPHKAPRPYAKSTPGSTPKGDESGTFRKRGDRWRGNVSKGGAGETRPQGLGDPAGWGGG